MPQWAVLDKGRQDYVQCWQAMRNYTMNRDSLSADQLWVVEHDAVFTVGRRNEHHHILQESAIPIIDVDRGGSVTYHGPGQLVVYVLFDLMRAQVGIRSLVAHLEQALIDMLRTFSVDADRLAGAPGVYTSQGKIAALGLCCKRQGTYHGLSLNVDMDLSPFRLINPCGRQQGVVDMAQLVGLVDKQQVQRQLLQFMQRPIKA